MAGRLMGAIAMSLTTEPQPWKCGVAEGGDVILSVMILMNGKTAVGSSA